MGNLAQAAGGAAMASGNPTAVGAGALVSSLGAYLNKEGMILDGDHIMRQALAAYDAVDGFEKPILAELQKVLVKRVSEGEVYGIPEGSSWLKDRFPVKTPNVDTLRERLVDPNVGRTGSSVIPSEITDDDGFVRGTGWLADLLGRRPSEPDEPTPGPASGLTPEMVERAIRPRPTR
jgi:hypothetical protein